MPSAGGFPAVAETCRRFRPSRQKRAGLAILGRISRSLSASRPEKAQVAMFGGAQPIAKPPLF